MDNNIDYTIEADAVVTEKNISDHKLCLETLPGPHYEQIDENSWVIEATGHTYGKPTWKWASDFSGATATFKCTSGDDTQKIEAYSITSEVITPATYTSEGEMTYTAKAKFNGKTYKRTKTAVIPKLTLVHYEAVPAGCTTDGSIEYWHDPDADKYFTDAEGANEITKAQTVVKAKGHRYANPVWHWSDDFTSATVDVTCKDCDDPVTLTATVTATVLVEPTYTTAGQTEYFAFASMGTQTFRYTMTVEVAKLALTHVKAVDSTCEAEGNTEYWYDAATGQYFSDAKGENEIDPEDTIVAKKEHAFGEPEFVWSEDNTSAEAVFNV